MEEGKASEAFESAEDAAEVEAGANPV